MAGKPAATDLQMTVSMSRLTSRKDAVAMPVSCTQGPLDKGTGWTSDLVTQSAVRISDHVDLICMHGSLPAVCMQPTVTSYGISLALASAAHMCCSTMIALMQA